MEFTFLKGGAVAFYRSDAEQAEWTQEEMSLLCTFPLDQKKIIERGMTVLFQDPATNAWQAYEIRNCSMFPGESYQQFTAEDIAISELTDCHLSDDRELTNVTAQAALAGILSGTGWNVGTNTASGTSTGNIGRGSVWEGVTAIRKNWNINILTRVTVGANGITGRYLDILNTNGTWRGLRLSIDKNCSDPTVTYDDSDLYTALYGYGASYTDGSTIYQQQTVETKFTSVSWSKTADHPAKPAGQDWLEWPEKTALYGRNGRARFGYYQNTDIKDPNVLLQKTWETLKIVSEPKISITGTVADLRRMGYADEPLRLYDMAIVEVGELQFYKQIIRLTVNLLDPTGNTPTIGSYIPSIIYINRETEEYATGGSTGAGGRGGGGSRSQKKQGEFETSILQNERNILLEARQVDENRNVLRQAGMQIDPVTGVLIYAEDNQNMVGAKFRVQANQISAEIEQRIASDHVMSTRIQQNANSISLEASERKGADSNLSARITVTAQEIRQEVVDVDNRLSTRITETAEAITLEANRATEAEGVLSGRITTTAEAITAEVTRAEGAESTLSGRITTTAEAITAEVTRATAAEGTLDGKIVVEAGKISQIVSAVGTNGEVTAASICLAINDGGSTATINADKIYLLGDTIADTITASYITSKLATVSQLIVNALKVQGVLTCEDGINCVAINVNHNNISNPILTASVSNNTLTLTNADGTVTTFSKATTLTGDWSGTYQAGKRFAVTASPQGNTYYSPYVNSIAKYGSPTWESNEYNQQVLVQDSDANAIYLGKIDVANIYSSGQQNTSLAVTYDSAVGKYKVYIVNNATQSMQVDYTDVLNTTTWNRAITVKVGGTTVKTETINDYNTGWNACIANSSLQERYTRSATGGGGAYGGNNYEHYILYQGNYKNVGSGWYQTSRADLYSLPNTRP